MAEQSTQSKTTSRNPGQKLHFRAVIPEDQVFLDDMLYEAITVPQGQPKISKEDASNIPELQKYTANWGREGDVGLIVEDEQHTPLGACWLRLHPASNPGYGFVQDGIPELSIAMLPGYQGKGIGTRLLAALLEVARHHFTAVSLSVTYDNPAKQLYLRFGFVDKELVGDSITMLKSLAD